MIIPKLKDLAAATGLHEMTVSRALRNVGRMRQETRQRVLDAARQMGYRPNAAAAAMRTGHTGCIVLISCPRPATAPHLTPDLLSAMIATVTAHGGYLAHAMIPGDDLADATALPRLLNCHMAEGVLLHDTPEELPRFEEFLQGNGLPAVWLNHKRKYNAVYADDFGAARKVTEQLLALGHTRIAFVRLARGSDGAHFSLTDRAAGYEAAMQQAGLRPEVLVFDGHWDQWTKPMASRLAPLARVFSEPSRRPTAVIVPHDGPVLLGLLQQLGVRVPEDVSLVSFTGSAAYTVEQMVSGVLLPMEALGRTAVEMLFRMIETPRTDLIPSICLPYDEIASLHTVRKLK